MRTGVVNFIGLYTIKFANMLAPLIYIPLSAEYLSSIEQDIFFIVLSLIGLNFIFVEFSGSITGYKFFHEYSKDKKEGQVFYEVLFFRIIVSVLVSVISCVYMASLSNSSSYAWFLLFMLNNMGYALYSSWFCLVKNNLVHNSLVILLARALPILPMYIGLFESSAFTFFTYISFFYFLLSLLEFRKLIVTYSLRLNYPVDFTTYFKKSYSVFIADTVPNLYNNIPIIIAPVIHGPSGFAAFFIANRVSSFLIQSCSILARSFMPTIDPLRKISFNKAGFVIVALVVAAMIIYLLSKLITDVISDVELFNKSYFQWLIASIIPVCIVHFINFLILIPGNEIGIYKKSNVTASLIFGLISILMAYIYGVDTLAIMLFFSRLGLLVITLYYAKRKIFEKFI